MKLGLFAALTGIAVAVGLSKMKRNEAAPAAKRPRVPAPTRPGKAPITGTAPQEGVTMKTAAPSTARTGGAHVTAP